MATITTTTTTSSSSSSSPLSDGSDVLSPSTDNTDSSGLGSSNENLQTFVTPTFEQRRKLVLCFDGTNGTFKSNAGDSNIVKLCQLFDRRTEDQYHYYQPGIGTYTPAPAEASYTSRDLIRTLTEKFDLAFGTSFPSHVISGYMFLTRYFTPGSTIHLFGFSRGAYTARFLADMLSKIGLLSAGNEEMIQFAYRSYVSYLEAKDGSKDEEEKRVYMESFRETYCRSVRVETLGLFDTVGSIAIFREGFPKVKEAPAKHIRHAIAIDERRSRFRPTIFEWEELNRNDGEGSFKEEWFAGDHTDIGGGHYPDPQGPTPKDGDASKSLKGYEAEAHSIGNVALSWMVQEIIAIQSQSLPEKERLTWKEEKVEALKKAAEVAAKIGRWHSNLDLKRMGPVAERSTLRRGFAHLRNFIEWGFWWFVEFTPPWKPQFGKRRLIPEGAVIHTSVHVKIKHDATYRPTNIPSKLVE
ncbi:hypothetical protein BJ508DRAFT_320662 [Ascobolus immersus RN42]|uniref:T6SS Phospholipase effector Tle1-like catalytic domain-containing protein n=1 Tax=Ascobolus immersus RN42 TaxID=1160509 RepID=A0A3N4IP13_ASCIM|nr:hypothetical protein BJ508DRAFT_320662 [Ascobolus immersus RN42]